MCLAALKDNPVKSDGFSSLSDGLPSNAYWHQSEQTQRRLTICQKLIYFLIDLPFTDDTRNRYRVTIVNRQGDDALLIVTTRNKVIHFQKLYT